MAAGNDWKHGYIPLTPQSMRQKNHGRPVKPGSWVTKLPGGRAPNEHAPAIADTASRTRNVDSPFAQAAAKHLDQAATHTRNGEHVHAHQQLQAATHALASGVTATSGPKQAALRDLRDRAGQHLNNAVGAQVDKALRDAAKRRGRRM